MLHNYAYATINWHKDDYNCHALVGTVAHKAFVGALKAEASTACIFVEAQGDFELRKEGREAFLFDSVQIQPRGRCSCSSHRLEVGNVAPPLLSCNDNACAHRW